MLTYSTPQNLNARDRILRTAHDLFYSVGIRATGVDRLIAEAGVTKTTFYRHFPSKNQLILAFLEYRHEIWIQWFKTAVKKHKDLADSLSSAMEEWFVKEDFRGCAFINSLSEMAKDIPKVSDIVSQHKSEIAGVLQSRLPKTANSEQQSQAIVMVMDGAIIRAQYSGEIELTIALLNKTIASLLK